MIKIGQKYIYHRENYPKVTMIFDNHNFILGGPGEYEERWWIEGGKLYLGQRNGSKRVVIEFNDDGIFCGEFIDHSKTKVKIWAATENDPVCQGFFNAQNVKYRAAVLLSGQVRTFNKTCHTLFNKVLSHLDADFFVHTWDKIGTVVSVHNEYDFSNNANIDLVKEIYAPKKIVVESQAAFRDTIDITRFQARTPGGMQAMNILCQWYSVYHSMQQLIKYTIETGTRYDVVIRTRFDTQFDSDIKIAEDFLFYTQENTVILPEKNQWGFFPEYNCNDSFSCGRFKEMRAYCDLYPNLDDIFYCGQNIPFHPETLLGWHMVRSGLKWKTVDFNYNLIR